jgi:putative intracellular protease/amidase
MSKPIAIGALLFDGFELLDMFGPLELFGLLPEHFSIHMVAERVGLISSAQGPQCLATDSFSDAREYDLILVPGGRGTRTEINNDALLAWLAQQATAADYVCSVCTGSALLACAGVLDGCRATSNKVAFSWVAAQSDRVEWVNEARWVEDGKRFTSSGVSAGMDMSLAVIGKILGFEKATEVANWAEYEWHQDSTRDPFAKICGLV